MKIVADASPVIFLGKLRRLSLLNDLFKGPFYFSHFVRNEILSERLSLTEKDYLEKVLHPWKVVSVDNLPKTKGALSISDSSVVHLSHQVHADLVLADDRALRNTLQAHRFKVLGTLGVLLLASKRRRLTAKDAKELANELITLHHFHISAETYKTFLNHLQPFS